MQQLALGNSRLDGGESPACHERSSNGKCIMNNPGDRSTMHERMFRILNNQANLDLPECLTMPG